MKNNEENNAVMEREFSFRSVLFGCIVGLVLMALMIYLLSVLGMDMNISPVATVLGIIFIPLFGGKTNRKEVNIMQTCASAVGFSCMALPTTYVVALFLGETFNPMELLLPLLLANVIGICFITIFKNQYVNDEALPFPQSQMCKSALDQIGVLGKKDARILFIAIFVGLVISFVQNMGIVPMLFDFTPYLPAGMTMGILAMPMMMGMGYILGMKVSLVLLIASFIANLVIGPIGTGVGWFENPQNDYTIQQYFLLPTVVGIATMGALIPMIKQRKAFISAFKFDKTMAGSEEDQKLVKLMLIVMVIASVALIVVCYISYDVAVWQMFLFILLGLVFSIISVRVQAESGMSASFALTIVVIFLSYLLTGDVVVAVTVATIACTTMMLSLNTMGDLKTGRMVDSTPKKQIWAQLIGVAVGTVGGVFFFAGIINGYGLEDPLFTFPVGRMNQVLAVGFSGDGASVFHMGRFLIGAGIGTVLALVSLPVGAIAIAIYLAPSTIMGIALGGVIRLIVEKAKGMEVAVRWNNAATGVVVGDALVSIILLFLMMAMQG